MEKTLLALLLVFFLGCTQTSVIEQNISCGEYCVSQPHITCVGSWNISGVYPDCFCGFVCETSSVEEVVNDTVIENETIMDEGIVEVVDACPDTVLTYPFINIDKIISISPLGNLNPPEHTLPTHHTYIHLSENSVGLYAPSDGTISSIAQMTVLSQGTIDYSIEISVCGNISIYFYHVKSVSQKILDGLVGLDCQTYWDYEHCYTSSNISIGAGEFLGTVGDDSQSNFDFGAYNKSLGSEPFYPERYDEWGSRQELVCPYELYNFSVRDEYFTKLAREGVFSCGEIVQDVPGTLKGNWFYTSGVDETMSMALVHDNHDSGLMVVSVGDVFNNSGRMIFSPEDSGLVNRNFTQVVPGGETYCFEDETYLLDGKMLIRMLNDTSIMAEYQAGECYRINSFIDPVFFFR